MNETANGFIEKKLKRDHPEYFSLYRVLKTWAGDIWNAYTTVPEQIDHGPAHSVKMLEYAGILLKPLLKKNSSYRLNGGELFLLAAAVVLHDIGMQTGWREFLDIDAGVAALAPHQRRLIRRKHADTTAHVLENFQSALPNWLEKNLTGDQQKTLQRDMCQPLALVCKLHNSPDIGKELDNRGDAVQIYRDRGIDIPLLAAMLQLCDALDMSKHRVNDAVFHDALPKFLDGTPHEAGYTEKEWLRFFRCYFVESVDLYPVTPGGDIFNIRLNLCFHPDEDKKLIKEFISVYWARLLRRAKNDCAGILEQEAGIQFTGSYPFEQKPPSSVKEKIPGQLFKIKSRAERPEAEDTGSETGLAGRELVGREKELNEIEEWLNRAVQTKIRKKFLVLRGAPGIGKTALALAVLADDQIRKKFPGGRFFVSLEGVRTAETMAARLKTELGVTSAGDDGLWNRLDGEPALVVLDNFEDPLAGHDNAEERAKTIKWMRLLAQHMGSAVFACTSREAMNDASIEILKPVGELKRGDARELLLKLGCNQGCEKEELESAGLDELLDELGNVPLAISLAAPYLAFGIERLLRDIRQSGVAVLRVPGLEDSGGDKDTSLDRSFGLSYGIVAETGAGEVFRTGWMFPAGFYLQDLEAVLPGLDVNHIMTLVSKSLLVRVKSNEYHMLAPLRRYSFHLFREDPDMEGKTARWYNWAERQAQEYNNTIRGKGTIPVSRLSARLPNIIAALDELKEQGIGQNDDRFFGILVGMADFLRFQGLTAISANFLSEARGRAGEREDTGNQAFFAEKLGEIYFMESRNNDALHAFNQALPLYKNIGDKLGEANCIRSIGSIHFRESRNNDALHAFNQALPLYKNIGSKLGEANCISSSGRIHIKQGDIEPGRNNLQKSIKLYRAIHDHYNMAAAYYNYALLFKDIDSHSVEALQLFKKAETIFREIKLPKDVEDCRNQIEKLSQKT